MTTMTDDSRAAMPLRPYLSLRIARDTTMPPALPIAWRIRAAINQPMLGANIQASVPIRHTNMLVSAIARRPK